MSSLYATSKRMLFRTLHVMSRLLSVITLFLIFLRIFFSDFSSALVSGNLVGMGYPSANRVRFSSSVSIRAPVDPFGWQLINGVCMGCRLLVVADDEDDDRNNRRVGDDLWCGDTLPPSLSLDVDEGGVGGSVKPEKWNERKLRLHTRSKKKKKENNQNNIVCVCVCVGVWVQGCCGVMVCGSRIIKYLSPALCFRYLPYLTANVCVCVGGERSVWCAQVMCYSNMMRYFVIIPVPSIFKPKFGTINLCGWLRKALEVNTTVVGSL